MSHNDTAWDEYLSTGIDPTGGHLESDASEDDEYPNEEYED